MGLREAGGRGKGGGELLIISSLSQVMVGFMSTGCGGWGEAGGGLFMVVISIT